ncbi:hypothetical protein KUG47_11840 [Falsochrobactrum sp. TDYN1]|uniref:Uncharacterized protein n=1 Tax=Falsochrobactrum tianjinense TaxID=2706015 RepID=A0A949PSQ9_9HYPH|nr:hypothetical protein [Falsochrobactrum sp. TDYN1]MBV2144185.1 hypothetical protein [Falsochrobactrum sp. TDYN1]
MAVANYLQLEEDLAASENLLAEEACAGCATADLAVALAGEPGLCRGGVGTGRHRMIYAVTAC